MTAREKLEKEHPVCVDESKLGGCVGCPSEYGYLKDPNNCAMIDEICRKCWDREVPETPKGLHIGDERVEHPDTDTIEGKFVEATPRILDSGNRRQFESGAVRDIQEGKGRCDLLPLDVVAYYLGKPEETDCVLQSICKFQNTGKIEYLYHALNFFMPHWDDGKTKASITDIIMQRRCSMTLEVAIHFEEGAKKYGDNNWRKGIPVRCYIDSGVRHYLKFLRGDKDEPHDRAFCWNMMCAIWTSKHHPELNDYAQKEEIKPVGEFDQDRAEKFWGEADTNG